MRDEPEKQITESQGLLWWAVAGSNRGPPACKRGCRVSERRAQESDGLHFGSSRHICVNLTRRGFGGAASVRPQSGMTQFLTLHIAQRSRPHFAWLARLFDSERRAAQRLAWFAGRPPSRHALIRSRVRSTFPSSTGQTGSPWGDLAESMDRLFADAGLNGEGTRRRDRITLHSLRHTFASWLGIAGVPLRRIQELLGYKSIATTERSSHLGANGMQPYYGEIASAVAAGFVTSGRVVANSPQGPIAQKVPSGSAGNFVTTLVTSAVLEGQPLEAAITVMACQSAHALEIDELLDAVSCAPHAAGPARRSAPGPGRSPDHARRSMLDFCFRFRWLFRDLLRRGELRPVPSAAKGRDQLNGSGHLRYLRHHQRLLIGQ